MFVPFRSIRHGVINTACAITIAASLAVSLATSPTMAATPPDTLVLAAAIDDIISLDPGTALEITSGEILGNTYDRLVRFDAQNPGNVRGDIAESWTVSPDGKTYTFKIKPGLIFASGNPITAEDVAFSMQRAVKLDRSPAFLLTQLGLTRANVEERAKAMPDGTFVLTTEKAFAPTFVLNCLSTNVGSAVDKKLVMEHEKDGDFGNGWLQANYAGSGPMKMREWRANEVLVLERNDKYYGEKPKLARVIYRHVKESATQRLMLETGDVDIARNLEPGDLETVEKNERLKLVSTLNGTLYYISLNMKNPKLAKPEVREAFKYLLDYDAIGATLIKGIGVIHQDFLPVGLPGSTGEKPYKYDTAKAKALLAKAGYPEGFEISFDVRNSQPVTGIAESFQRSAAEAGVKIDIIPGNGKQTLTKYRGRKHDLYIGEWSLKYWDPHANADAFSNVPDTGDDAKYQTLAWRNGWEAKAETAKTSAALLESDPKKRIEMYHDLLKDFTGNSPFVMVYQMRETSATSKKINNFILGPVPYTNFVYTASKS
jgi:peptide/nickel transport system substrate-binding protein